MKSCTLLSFILAFCDLSVASADLNQVTEIGAEVCKAGKVRIAKTPFEVDFFCEDALGSYIGIVYRGIMGTPAAGAWSIKDRYWQVKDWSVGVESILPVNGGNSLLVSTSSIHGNGGVYLLRLKERRWKKVFQTSNKNKEEYFVIKEFDEKLRKVTFFDKSIPGGNVLEALVGK
jgi:hypothetical protein